MHETEANPFEKARTPVTRRGALQASGVAAAAVLAGPFAPGALGGSARCTLYKGEARRLEKPLRALANDRDVRRYLRRTIRPLLRQLAAGLEATTGTPTEPLPTHHLTDEERQEIEDGVRAELPRLLQLGPSGPPPGDARIDELVEAALVQLEQTLASPAIDPALGPRAVANQQADFNAMLVGNAFVALDDIARGLIVLVPAVALNGGGGGGAVADDTLDVATIILLISLIIELIGLIAAVAGITLPKVNLAKLLGTARAHLTSPSVRAAVRALMQALRDGTKSMTFKAEAIVTFLRVLNAEGLLSRLVSEMISDWDWEDYLRLGLGLLVTILSFVATGGTATAAKIALALAAALLEIVNKIDELVDRM